GDAHDAVPVERDQHPVVGPVLAGQPTDLPLDLAPATGEESQVEAPVVGLVVQGPQAGRVGRAYRPDVDDPAVGGERGMAGRGRGGGFGDGRVGGHGQSPRWCPPTLPPAAAAGAVADDPIRRDQRLCAPRPATTEGEDVGRTDGGTATDATGTRTAVPV